MAFPSNLLPSGPLGVLGAALGQILTRTVFLQTNTPSGIPIPLAVFDVINDEKPVFRAEVTEHPVEMGPEVTDHIQIKNTTMTLKGKFSNTPLDISIAIANTLSGGYMALTNSQARSNLINSGISQGVGIIGASLMGGASNAAASGAAGALDAIARTILLTAFQNKTPFNVVTKRQTYPNMVIESLTFPRNESTGYALEFEVSLKQVRIVSPLKVQKTQVAENVIPSASGSTNIGSQSTSQASPQMRSQMQNSNMAVA